ncbi:hypothetical protein NAP1_13493 [Erythrobacter sp. NAP1]|uniref:hypothetical protein n=1 Tax=Erythrobacter sp. NAP1 TaxID=237727 RepID=UPI0000687777|nr:hypothetical protein [Erythrobacter sp. NAP1]EAQ28616.1 hypothetical protein NAP1_13493 [Erythrobacter sp. NAP1]
MTLFAPDLYRNFALGFAAGGLLVGAATIDQWGPELESHAIAAQPLEAPQPADEFLIVPFEADTAENAE